MKPHPYIFYQLPVPTRVPVGKQQLAPHYHFQSGLRIRNRTVIVRFNLSCLLRIRIRTPNMDPYPVVKITLQYSKNTDENIFESVLSQFFETDPKLSRKAEYGPDPNIMNWYGFYFFHPVRT